MAKKSHKTKKPNRTGKKKSGGSGSKKSPARLRSELKHALLEKVGDLSSRQFKARTKRQKKKIGKQISTVKQEYNRLSK